MGFSERTPGLAALAARLEGCHHWNYCQNWLLSSGPLGSLYRTYVVTSYQFDMIMAYIPLLPSSTGRAEVPSGWYLKWRPGHCVKMRTLHTAFLG